MKPFIAAQIVPTGIGASLGGYAGDATPATNLLASVCDTLITHPNALNAAVMYRARPNLSYVEGYALDQFFLGRWALRPVRSNRVAVLVDRALEADQTARAHIENAMGAVHAVAGVSIEGWEFTPEPLELRVEMAESGASTGALHNPDALIQGATRLVDQGATAIALVSRIPAMPPEAEAAYMRAAGPDPIGGLEALLSHVLVREFEIPCANAPYEPPGPIEAVDPRLAAEAIGYTFVPCVLEGLAKAPHYVRAEDARYTDVRIEDVDAVVAPYDACGGVPMLEAARRGIPLIAVRERVVARAVTPDDLGLPHVTVRNYVEAAGILLALREGIDPASVYRP